MHARFQSFAHESVLPICWKLEDGLREKSSEFYLYDPFKRECTHTQKRFSLSGYLLAFERARFAKRWQSVSGFKLESEGNVEPETRKSTFAGGDEDLGKVPTNESSFGFVVGTVHLPTKNSFVGSETGWKRRIALAEGDLLSRLEILEASTFVNGTIKDKNE